MIPTKESAELKNNVGVTPIFYAADLGRTEILPLLEKQGANLRDRNQCGESAAYCAARNGHLDILVELKKLGIDINEKSDTNNSSDTPITLLLKNRSVIEKLIENYFTYKAYFDLFQENKSLFLEKLKKLSHYHLKNMQMNLFLR